MSSPDLLQVFQSCAVDLRRFLTKQVRCEATAADLSQEAYLRLSQTKGLQPIRNLRAFLFQVAANLAIDHLRAQTRFQQRYAGTLSTELVGATPTPDRELEAKQEWALLQEAIDELPPKCRQAFLLLDSLRDIQ